VASGPAGSATAAARKPAATAHKPARKHPAAKNTPGTARGKPCLPRRGDLLDRSQRTLLGRTPGGATIFQGVIGPGTSKTWTERQAVTLKLGNPGAVTLTVDGKSRTGLGSHPVTLSLGPGQGTPG
jgi:hypothetical protein